MERMAIHSLHFPNNFLLQELQGLFCLAWKAERETVRRSFRFNEHVCVLSMGGDTEVKAAGSWPQGTTFYWVTFTKG